MDSESKASVTETTPASTGETTPAAMATAAAAAAAKAPPVPAPHRLEEVVKQLKAELISDHERRWGSNPYDSQLGRPSRDVWGIRKRA